MAVVRRLLDAFARRDIESALELVDPSLVLAAPRTGKAAGRPDELYIGHDGLRMYFGDVQRAWQRLEVEAGEYREHEDVVVVIGRLHVRSQKGEQQDSEAAWAFRVREGKVTWLRVYTDPALALREARFPGRSGA